jgi:hypothetical protein
MTSMRALLFLPAAAAACLAAGCGQEPAAAQAPAREPVDIERLMVGTIEPAAAVIWNAVSTTVTAEGMDERFPRTDREWAVVRNSAIRIADAGMLLMSGDRPAAFAGFARALVTAARENAAAADARDPDAVLEAGGRLYEACVACHTRYPGRMQNE